MFPNPKYTLVAINYWPEPTGNGPYNKDLAEELQRHGAVRVVTGVPHYPWWKKQSSHSDSDYISKNPNLELLRVNHPVPAKQSNLARAVMELAFGIRAISTWKLEAEKFILVSPAMLSTVVILAWIKTFKRKKKVVVWVQDLYEQGLKETSSRKSILSKLVVRAENWVLSNADRVVFAHPGFLDAKSSLKVRRERYFAIANWSQFNFAPSETSLETRSRYGLEGSRVVLHIGNMGVKQGLQHVLLCAKLAATEAPKTIFVFVGGGNQLGSLQKLAKDLQISNVMFVPPVSEVELSNLLHMADVLLVHELPGVKEMSVPSKLTTYFLSGSPVLVCSEPDSLAAKTLNESGTGFWVKSGDPEALLAKIQTLDLEKAKSVAQIAKQYAELNLGKSEALAKFMSIINDI